MTLSRSTISRVSFDECVYGQAAIRARWDAARSLNTVANDNGAGKDRDLWAILILQVATFSLAGAVALRGLRMGGMTWGAFVEGIGAFAAEGASDASA
jgi:hypothetical protein